MSLPRASRAWLYAAAGLVLAQVTASALLSRGYILLTLTDVLQCLLLVSGALALAPNIMANQGRARLFWALMTLGVALWLSYQVLWTYLEVVLRRDVPDPFGGDVVLFLHFVPMMAALALQPHYEHDERSTRLGSLDFTLLLLWWLFLYFFAVFPWQYISSNESAYDLNFNALYLVEKIAFLAGLAMVWARSDGTWKKTYAQWFQASVIYALGSYVANWAITRGAYYSSGIYDVPLTVSIAWITAIGLTALDSSTVGRPPRQKTSYGVWVARVGMVAVFSLPFFAAWSLFDHAVPENVRIFRLLISLSGMLVMGSLVILKQHLLDRELLHLLRASQESFDNLQRLQTQLLQSEKLASLGQLVGGAAHELNNPLTAMLGYSEMLLETSLSPEQRSLTEKISLQVRRTKTLVSNLLSFAKQVPTQKTALDLNMLAQTAIRLCQPQLSSRNIQVRLELTPGLPKILGDSNQLLQVCLHISNNALNAMSQAGGAITLSSSQHEDFVVLEYSDNGPGMAEPDRVFDPFYTTRPVGQGSGLGLSACYGIVQEHHGTITCRNRPEGGATFRIELPVAKTARVESTAKLGAPADSSIAKEATAAGTLAHSLGKTD